MDVLQLQGASKEFDGGIKAVDSVTLGVPAGSLLTIVGPSGCGKTTLLRLIAGLTLPTEGRILMDGVEVTGPGPDRGLVFQQYTSFPWLTVRENIAFGLQLDSRFDHATASRKVERLLAAVRLAEFGNAFPRTLSGGQQQRVALARSLAVEPRVLLLDEPFGALDAQTRDEMQLLLLRLWETLRQTMLFVTHDIGEAVFLGERIVISTPRPFRVAQELKTGFEGVRSQTAKLLPQFIRVEQRVTTVLREYLMRAGDD
jgi:ABC-type nitrate/sulfonate/bicarbonate transport system ATPase subunit